MNKLLYSLFLFGTLFIDACETNNVSKITRGVKVIGKCCKELALDKRKPSGKRKGENDNTAPADNVPSVLPAYFWDTKSMIW